MGIRDKQIKEMTNCLETRHAVFLDLWLNKMESATQAEELAQRIQAQIPVSNDKEKLKQNIEVVRETLLAACVDAVCSFGTRLEELTTSQEQSDIRLTSYCALLEFWQDLPKGDLGKRVGVGKLLEALRELGDSFVRESTN